MSDLIDWYRKTENAGEHPIVIAATFHYRFVRIHPFDDGNGRMARLLMNMILIKHGYTVAIIPIQERDRYIGTLEQADKSEDLADFISYVAGCCEFTLNLHLRAARGEEIEDVEDIDKEIALFKRSLQADTGEAIQAKKYAKEVIYPLFVFCKEKLEQFSEYFESFTVLGNSSSVRGDDNQIGTFRLSEGVETLPENALFVSTRIEFYLSQYQAKKGTSFSYNIENEVDSNRCVWMFKSHNLNYEREYSGQDLVILIKIFNEMLRSMMKKLSNEFKEREPK